MSDTPRTDTLLAEIRLNPGAGGCIPKEFARDLERENTTLRNYLMTSASDDAKPGDAKTLWRKVRGEML